MFKIYLYHWAKDFDVTTEQYTLVKNETEVLSIPVDSPDKIWLVSPAVKAEVNKAESFDFTVMPGTAYYNAFIRLKTWIRVTYKSTTIFWGRVKTINDSGTLHKRSIHAEGVYSLLGESPVEGLEEDLQDNLTGRTYFDFLIDSHNSFIEEDFKKFSAGSIKIDFDPRSKKRRPTSWTTTLSELNNLVDEHGGYIRARYNDDWQTNGKHRNYIDWVKHYFRDRGEGNRPSIKLARNLIDISKSAANNEIFTRLIPVGHQSTTSTSSSSSSKKKSSSSSSSSSSSTTTSFVYISGSKKYIKIKDVPGMISSDVSKQKKELEADGFRKIKDFTDAEKNYGVIYKTESFSNASSSTDLKNYALEWIKNNYYGIVPSFSIKAIDMHMLGEKDPQILVGDVVDVSYPEYDNDGTMHLITRKLICKAVQYNLLNPESNTYTLGVPCEATDFEYGTKSTSSTSTSKSSASSAASSRSSSGGGGGGNSNITWSMVLGWLLYYYYTVPDSKVVDWTETRWTTFKQKVNENDKDERLLYIVDQKPYNTFKSNGEFVTKKLIEDGTNSNGEKLYKTEYINTYRTFKKPDSDDTVRGRILGHYEITQSNTKPAQAAKYNAASGKVNSSGQLLSYGQPIDTSKAYGNGAYHYGVCVTDDGHAYTFHWQSFAATYGSHYAEETSNEVFSTYFEIAKTDGSGAVNPEELITAGTGGDDPAEKNMAITWKNHNGMTTAEIGTEEGWSTFGYITDDDGNVKPAIKLNDTITYTDAQGNVVTKSGFVTAQDLNLSEIGPFSTKIAVIDNAIMERATVMELRAAIAILGGDEAYGASSYEHDANGNPIIENGKWKLRQGTKFITNSKNVIAASGIYGVREITDPVTGRKSEELYIKDGAGFKIEKENPNHAGHKAYFGVWDENNLTGGILAEKINGESNVYIRGDHINIGNDKTKRVLTEATKELAQVVGTYVWDTDEWGNKYIKGLNGSGSHVWRDGAAYGLWDQGNLTAGVMVEKLNSGETQTRIKGDRIKIGESGTKSVSLTDAITINSQGFLTSKSGMWVQGDLHVTKTGGSGGVLYASDISVGVGGSLKFSDRSAGASSVVLNRDKVYNLLNTTAHVKITGPTSDGKYTLWYLPASLSDNNSNWVECGNFNSATTNVVVNWKGGTSYSQMIVTAGAGGKELYKASFGGSVSGFQQYFDLNINSNETPILAGQRSIAANIYLYRGTLNSSGDIVTSTPFYSRRLIINADPVWDKAYGTGYDTASALAKITKQSDIRLTFAYPTSKTVGGQIVRSDESKTYTLRNVTDYAYLSIMKTGNESGWTNILSLNHGQYSSGLSVGTNNEKKIIYARFNYTSTNGYYIEPYENSGSPHSTTLSDGKLKYKLARQISSGNYTRTIEIQNTSSTKISNTPTLNFPVDHIKVTSNNTDNYTGSAYYVIERINDTDSTNSTIKKINTAQMVLGSINDSGVRTITLKLVGPKSSGSGNNTFNSVKVKIDDYKQGHTQGVGDGRYELLQEGYAKYNHSATITCYNVANLGTAGNRYYFYCDSYICDKDDDKEVHW